MRKRMKPKFDKTGWLYTMVRDGVETNRLTFVESSNFYQTGDEIEMTTNTFTFAQDPVTLTVKALTDFFNQNSDETIAKWSQSKAKLIERISDLKGYKRPTIRALAETLLLEVASEDEESGRNIGLPYDAILERIHNAFPDCECSVKCLRWYAVKMKEDEKVLQLMPVRPRKRTAKAEA